MALTVRALRFLIGIVVLATIIVVGRLLVVIAPGLGGLP